MRYRFLALFLAALAALAAPAQDCAVANPSLEDAGAGWVSTSTNFPTALCNNADCGDGGGSSVPRTGAWYAWFGGAGGTNEIGTLTQTFNVPDAEIVELQFYYKCAQFATDVASTLTVAMDGNVLLTLNAGDPLYISEYVLVTVDISAYAGGSHTLLFTGNQVAGNATTNMLVDDICVVEKCSSFANVDGAVAIGETEAPATSVAEASDDLVITDVGVEVKLTHPFLAELALTLVSPAGTRVLLMAERGDDGDNLDGTDFDDEAAQAIGEGTAPFSGSFRPEEPLSALDLERSQGIWKLEVLDLNPGDNVGALDGWSITICGNPPVTCEPGRVPNGDFTACEICPAGTYSPDGTACLPCAEGTASAVPGSTSCEPCSVGFAPNIDRTGCEICPPGTYSPDGTACLPCPAGNISGEGAAICEPCLVGSAPNPEGTSCIPCDGGTYSADGIKCTICPPGTVSGVGAGECAACGPGTAPNAAGDACEPCPPGSYSSDGILCDICPLGTVNPDLGAAECVPCAPGKAPNVSRTLCDECPAGFFSDGSICLECTENNYSDVP